MSNSLEELINGLAGQADLDDLLKSLAATPRQAARALTSRRGRLQMEARRTLVQAQVDLQARRLTGRVVAELSDLLNSGKPDVKLKVAATLLSLVYGKGKVGDPAEEKRSPIAAEEAKEWMSAVAEVLARKRREAAMGPRPEPPVKERPEGSDGSQGVGTPQ